MLRVPIENLGITRTLKAEYPGLPWGMKLHPDWDKSIDIVPGTVMAHLGGEYVAPFGQDFGDINSEDQVPFGLSALFLAPELGVNEVTHGDFTVWVGDAASVFRVLEGAYDNEATWTIVPGTKQFVYANAKAQLTTVKKGEPIGTLITDGTSQGFIRITLDNVPLSGI